MTKKNIALILIIAIFISVIAMAVWGKLPDTSADVFVTGMNFYNASGALVEDINDSDDQEKKITLNRDTDGLTYTFTVELLPQEATDLTLTYAVDKGEAQIVPANEQNYTTNEETSEVVYHNKFSFKITFAEKAITRVQFTSNYSGPLRIRDYLLFVWEGTEHGGDIDI